MIRLALASFLTAVLAISGAAVAPTRGVGTGQVLAAAGWTAERAAPYRIAPGRETHAGPTALVTATWPSEPAAHQPPPAYALFQRPPPLALPLL